jgi:tRNA(Ile)-lysidine synthase
LYQWLKEFGFTAWEDIYDLVHSQSGKYVVSEEFRLVKDREFLILSSKEVLENEVFYIQESEKQIQFPVKLRLSDESHIENPSSGCIFVDKEKLKFPLIIRKWQEGDYFYPSGMHGKKKVSKYFKDEKFSLIDKEKTWLLCSDNQIIWIVNHRADEQFLATTNTQNIIKIELQ